MTTTTEPTPLDAKLDALDAKLDRVLEEVDEVRRMRREIEELKDDLSRVAKDLFATTVTELEEVAPFVRTGDFTDLAKRLLRNTNTLDEMLIQLESARALLADATPLGRKLFHDTLEQLDELDHKGYFDKGQELLRALDNVVAEFSVEDVRQLADNATTILHTVKNLTQPEMLDAVDNALEIYRKIDFNTVEEYSPFRAFREINKPEMRRGIGFMIVFLRNLSAHQPPPPKS
ncbi:hypothetical protein [Synoicihabitans lomoniglobus]|uniref:DUF1641 domain-containing protein n=1 Tax=Synoicihabitans lomoniglobus TaxID=2909285 RepID=A0AAF0CN21_9BACT|nr:hypothetical protein [Opitutaceae bacterium LMO-M01]WED64923.1 hypothetical protein PXH66_21460 [Opitutaceae bacterium LMO-M01]